MAEERARVERVAIGAAMQAEQRAGRTPEDLSARHGIGYDIRSCDSEGRQLFLEVKGFAPGTREIALSKNEIIAAKNAPELFRLVLVRVEGERAAEVRYVSNYDFGNPGLDQICGTFPLDALLAKSGG